MNRTLQLILYGFLAFFVSILSSLATQAQDNDNVRVPIVSAPTFISIQEGEPLVLWVRSAKDEVAQAVVLVENPDGGYTQLTPCDNVEVVCEDALIPAQGTQPGDTFFLASE